MGLHRGHIPIIVGVICTETGRAEWGDFCMPLGTFCQTQTLSQRSVLSASLTEITYYAIRSQIFNLLFEPVPVHFYCSVVFFINHTTYDSIHYNYLHSQQIDPCVL